MAIAPDAHEVACAFRLPDPKGWLVPVRHGSSETWRLDTFDGRYFVKRLAVDGRSDQLEKAMAFEVRASAAGVPAPAPVEPVHPAWGLAADLGDGLGVLRVHPWLDGEPPTAEVDLSRWYGATLARLHSVQPAGDQPTDAMWPLWYGVNSAEAWDGWLAAGLAQERPWAAVLKERLPLIADLTACVEAAYQEVGDYVVTHRDLLPHNVLLAGGRGPVLIDWDTAGPDSATLEAAAAAFDGARLDPGHAGQAGHSGHAVEPDPARIAATLAAYRDNGGDLRPCDFLLARRLGVHLARCAERIRVTLGTEPAGSLDPAAADARAAQQLTGLPEFASLLFRWSQRME